MRTDRVFKRLLELHHRGSATDQESQAQKIVMEFLKEEGVSSHLQGFSCPKSYGWELMVISGILGIGGLIPSGVWVVLGAVWFFLYFTGFGTPWDPLFHWGRSANLIAGWGEGEKNLILLAHLDSAKSASYFHPRWVRFFRAQFLLHTLLLLLLLAGVFLNISPLARILGVFFFLEAVLWIHRELFYPYVPGVNDNLSGVISALELFLRLRDDPLPGVRVTLLITGGEEVGMKGARAYLRYTPPLPNTVVLNLDNVGAGTLYAIQGEGMLTVTRYPGALAQSLAPRFLPCAIYRLAYFDALPFARRGYETLTLIRLKDGIPPNWHLKSDTLENLEEGAIPDTIEQAERLLKERFRG
jgi:hypothetical protein